MKKTILLAVLMVGLLAIPAFASVQNVKVSGDIDSTYLYRKNFDLGRHDIGTDLGSDDVQSVFITQTRLRVDAELTDNVSTVLILLNERGWGAEDDPTSNNTDMDINVAYVMLKEMLYSPLTVYIGRLNNLQYGNSFIMDDTGPNNQSSGALGSIANDLTLRSELDGIKLVLDYKPLTIDLFFAKEDANTITAVEDDEDDIDLWGANANYQLGDKMNTEVETYFFARIDKSTDGTGGASADEADTIYVPGLRGSTNPIEGLNVQAEIAWQRGNKVYTTTAIGNNQRRDAMGAQAIASYQVPLEAVKKWKPVVTGIYTYTSGDKSTSSDLAYSREASREEYRAWDPFHENQGGGTVYSNLFDLTNLHIYSVGAQVSPIEDVIAKVTWSGLWFDKEIRSGSLTIRQAEGGTLSVSTGRDDEEVGHEIDAELIYDYTEDVQFGLLLGWFNPGDAFTSANDDTASQALVHGKVSF